MFIVTIHVARSCVYMGARPKVERSSRAYSFVRRLSGEVDGIDIAVINRDNDFI